MQPRAPRARPSSAPPCRAGTAAAPAPRRPRRRAPTAPRASASMRPRAAQRRARARAAPASQPLAETRERVAGDDLRRRRAPARVERVRASVSIGASSDLPARVGVARTARRRSRPCAHPSRPRRRAAASPLRASSATASKRVDRQHRLAGAEGEALRHRAGGAQAGEGAGAAAERDRVELAHAACRRIGQQAAGSPAASVADACAPPAAFVRPDPAARRQRDADALGGGVEGEQGVHRGAQSRPSAWRQRSILPSELACDHRRMQVATVSQRSRWSLLVARAALAAQRRRPRTGCAARGTSMPRCRARQAAARGAGRAACRRSARRAPRLAWQADQPVNPASLMKLRDDLRRARAARPGVDLDHAGVAARARSRRRADGDLVIKGTGDPKLVLERMWLLLRRVQQLGVREIRGDIVLDRSAFVAPEQSPADFDGEPLRPYNVQRRCAAAQLHARCC